jgi:hypothetical protein
MASSSLSFRGTGALGDRLELRGSPGAGNPGPVAVTNAIPDAQLLTLSKDPDIQKGLRELAARPGPNGVLIRRLLQAAIGRRIEMLGPGQIDARLRDRDPIRSMDQVRAAEGLGFVPHAMLNPFQADNQKLLVYMNTYRSDPRITLQGLLIGLLDGGRETPSLELYGAAKNLAEDLAPLPTQPADPRRLQPERLFSEGRTRVSWKVPVSVPLLDPQGDLALRATRLLGAEASQTLPTLRAMPGLPRALAEFAARREASRYALPTLSPVDPATEAMIVRLARSDEPPMRDLPRTEQLLRAVAKTQIPGGFSGRELLKAFDDAKVVFDLQRGLIYAGNTAMEGDFDTRGRYHSSFTSLADETWQGDLVGMLHEGFHGILRGYRTATHAPGVNPKSIEEELVVRRMAKGVVTAMARQWTGGPLATDDGDASPSTLINRDYFLDPMPLGIAQQMQAALAPYLKGRPLASLPGFEGLGTIGAEIAAANAAWPSTHQR